MPDVFCMTTSSADCLFDSRCGPVRAHDRREITSGAEVRVQWPVVSADTIRRYYRETRSGRSGQQEKITDVAHERTLRAERNRFVAHQPATTRDGDRFD